MNSIKETMQTFAINQALKAVKNLKRAFPNLEVHPFKDLGHGEIMTRKELLVKELKTFLKKEIYDIKEPEWDFCFDTFLL